jgi:DNA-binding CsgD family transcriptional regulator
MVATGRTRTEIAAYTQLNAHNITVQIAIVRDKLGVRNDVELTLFLYGMLDQATTA